MKLPIVITLGDPAGIGPEIIAKAFRNAPDTVRGCFVAGDVTTLRCAAATLQGDSQVSLPVAEIDTPAAALTAPPRCVPVLQVVPRAEPVALGQVSAAAGKMAGDCVFWAARAALRGEVGAIVTAPLHKEALSAAGAPYSLYPGHTELLQAVAAEHLGVPVAELPVRMMLANDELRTVLVSIHVSLRDAIEIVTASNILQTLRITHQSVGAALQKTVRIGVAGLNPHAGEGGHMGTEEIDTIIPVLEEMRAKGMNLSGPLPADTLFQPKYLDHADAVLAMYHDQGLPVLKYQGFGRGMNITLGLPFIRTSVDHGTALELAGQGKAEVGSFITALNLAIKMIVNTQ